MRNFTLFSPTDKAIQQAYRSGSLNYPYLFAKNKTLLDGIVAYHAVPQFQFTSPSKQTLNMKTLLTEVSQLHNHTNRPELLWNAYALRVRLRSAGPGYSQGRRHTQ